MLNKEHLKIAIQKKGRLHRDTIELLEQCGLKISLHNQRLISHVSNMPIDILLVRDDDIPGLVMDGVVDLGIVGDNELQEKYLDRKRLGGAADYTALKRLDFGGCRLSIAVPDEVEYDGLEYLQEKTIATSYPEMLRRYLREQGVNFSLCNLTGSVEVAPRANLADAICDLVSTGGTLEANGLREVEVVFRSQAMLIRSVSDVSSEIQMLIDKLLTRIQGVMQARESKYIMLHAPKDKLDQVVELLPGKEHPSVMPLAHCSDTVAVHCVSPEELFWTTIERLKKIGCSSILVMPIEKMMQ